MIDLESEVAAFQHQAAPSEAQESANRAVEDATEASLSPHAQLFLMKLLELHTTGTSTLFAFGLACGWIKGDEMQDSMPLDFLCMIRQLGRQAGLSMGHVCWWLW